MKFVGSGRVVPGYEQHEAACLMLICQQECIEQGKRWRDDLLKGVNEDLNGQRMRPLLGYEQSKMNGILAASGECVQADRDDIIHIAGNNSSAYQTTDESSYRPQSSHRSTLSYSELPGSSERSSVEIADTHWRNPRDWSSEEAAAYDVSEQRADGPGESADSRQCTDEYPQDLQGPIEVTESFDPKLNGAIAKKNGARTGVSTDTRSCARHSSCSEDDVMEWCNRHYWRELNKRIRTAAQVELEHETIGRRQDVYIHDLQTISDNDAVVADKSQNSRARDGLAHRGQSSEEAETRQWYEKRYMLEIESLPAKRQRK